MRTPLSKEERKALGLLTKEEVAAQLRIASSTLDRKRRLKTIELREVHFDAPGHDNHRGGRRCLFFLEDEVRQLVARHGLSSVNRLAPSGLGA